MGLDQYLYGRVSRYCQKADEECEDGFPVRAKELEIGYWRKHYALNEYIDREFGLDENSSIYLEAADIRQILEVVINNELPVSEDAEERKRHDIEVFTAALEWLEKESAPNVWQHKKIKYETCS